MNSAALCYVHKPTAKRTPDILTHQSSRVYFSLWLSSIIHAKWHEDQNSIQYPKIHCWQSEEVSVAVSCGSIVLMSKDFLRCRWDFLLRSVQTLYRNTKDFVLNGYTEKTEAHIFFVTGTEMVIELEHWQSSEFLQSYSSGCTAWPLKPGTFLSISFLMCIPLIKYVIVKGILDLRADSLLLSLWKLHRM